MTKQNIKTKEGFTIIEVVLVLAIAGLIFLMVFVALPALQRSQRDTQRRNDMSRLSTALTNYQTNNSNNLPGEGSGTPTDISSCSSTDHICTFVKKYLNSPDDTVNTFADPDGATYTITIEDFVATSTVTDEETGETYTVSNSVPDKFEDHIALIVRGAKCGPDETAAKASGARQFAVMYRLEGAGVYCVDNQ